MGGTKDCAEKAICEICGGEYGDSREHTWDSGRETTPPTCTKNDVKTFTCTVNDCSATKTEMSDKVPHVKVGLPAIAATCTATGLTAGVKCSVCEEIIKAQKAVSLIAHSYVKRIRILVR